MAVSDWSSQERGHLDAVLEAPGDHDRRAEYARWLREAGQPERATVVKQTINVARGAAVDRLRHQLDALEPQSQGWSRMVGARLVAAMAERGRTDAIARWLPLARPALQWVVGSPCANPPVGGSRMWGDPDGPSSMRWPTRGDCKHWEAVDLSDELPCRFVAQVDFASLAGSPVAKALPDRGLLSIFCHSEFDEHGTASVCLRYHADTQDLVRHEHAAADDANARVDPHAIELVEALTLPEHSGPWANELAIGRGDFAAMDALREINEASGGASYGLLGHMTATTSEDPTPAENWVRLAWLPAEPDQSLLLHLAVEPDALGGADFERFDLAWVDFDGG